MEIYITIWRYSINKGEFGGIVFADTLELAEEKVRKKYPDKEKEILVWRIINDNYFDRENPDVWECCGI